MWMGRVPGMIDEPLGSTVSFMGRTGLCLPVVALIVIVGSPIPVHVEAHGVSTSPQIALFSLGVILGFFWLRTSYGERGDAVSSHEMKLPVFTICCLVLICIGNVAGFFSAGASDDQGWSRATTVLNTVTMLSSGVVGLFLPFLPPRAMGFPPSKRAYHPAIDSRHATSHVLLVAVVGLSVAFTSRSVATQVSVLLPELSGLASPMAAAVFFIGAFSVRPTAQSRPDVSQNDFLWYLFYWAVGSFCWIAASRAVRLSLLAHPSITGIFIAIGICAACVLRWGSTEQGPSLKQVDSSNPDSGEGDSLGPLTDFKLAPRELEVTTALIEGDSTSAIAESLGISPSTVRSILQRVYKKAGVNGKAELLDTIHSLDMGHRATESLSKAVSMDGEGSDRDGVQAERLLMLLSLTVPAIALLLICLLVPAGDWGVYRMPLYVTAILSILVGSLALTSDPVAHVSNLSSGSEVKSEFSKLTGGPVRPIDLVCAISTGAFLALCLFGAVLSRFENYQSTALFLSSFIFITISVDKVMSIYSINVSIYKCIIILIVLTVLYTSNSFSIVLFVTIVILTIFNMISSFIRRYYLNIVIIHYIFGISVILLDFEHMLSIYSKYDNLVNFQIIITLILLITGIIGISEVIRFERLNSCERFGTSRNEQLKHYLIGRGLNELQTQVILGILDDRSSSQLARTLGYSRGSINSARFMAYRKLGVHSKADLIILVARETGR